jgi:hypothetical protein
MDYQIKRKNGRNVSIYRANTLGKALAIPSLFLDGIISAYDANKRAFLK